MIHSDQIFFLVIIARAHDTVYQIALIRHKKKAFRFAVKSSHRVDAHRIIQVFCNCDFLTLFLRTADNSPWFIKKKQHFFCCLPHRFPVHKDFRRRVHLLPGKDRASVDADSSLFNHPVGLAAGTHAGAAQIFIYSNRFSAFNTFIFVHCYIIYFFPVIRNKQIPGRLVFSC